MDSKLETILQTSMDRGSLHPDEIPSLDLYMDQIITLLQTHFQDQPPLTRSMIHNYSKEGILKPVKGKKYSREHIMQMLAVYSMKNTLSIGEIHRVLAGTYAQEGFGEAELAQCFTRYLDTADAQKRILTQSVEQMNRDCGLNADTPADALTLLLAVTAAADALEDFAGRIVEEYFPPLEKK
ncbi:MAG: DUF1836 domain-containing protein [Butyricicoccaceae bacterium]